MAKQTTISFEYNIDKKCTLTKSDRETTPIFNMHATLLEISNYSAQQNLICVYNKNGTTRDVLIGQLNSIFEYINTWAIKS